jgi:magnesium transporter
MTTVSKRQKKPAGSSPGSVVYVGVDKDTPVTVTRVRYAPDTYEPARVVPPNECRPDTSSSGVVWYTVDGVHNVDILKTLGENFSLHPLVVEDIGNTTQRPKLEGFDGYYFLAAKMITYDARFSKLRSEHVSIVFGRGFVVLFLQDPGDLFAPVRQRLEAGKGRIRASGSDYLVYALVDAIVDYYFNVLEELGERVEKLEDDVVVNPTVTTLRAIHHVKRELIALRRSIWPMREVVNALIRDESPLVSPDVKIYLRDLYDHTVHVIDSVETMRDIITGTLDVYLSSVSNRLNQVMKVLTAVSTIILPMTLISGIYGMNFEHMPELEWKYGYFLIVGVMATICVTLFIRFKRAGWL